jgi:ATP-dependent DNA ligase
MMYVDHFEGAGKAPLERVCKFDREGIAAKQKFAPYGTEREDSTWKIACGKG